MNKPYEIFKEIIKKYNLPLEDELVKNLVDIFEAQKDKEKPEITEAGLEILSYMQEVATTTMKAKDIADGMGLPSRKVSGSIRKLVTDGFVEKFGSSPVIYSLTAKGKEFDIAAYKEKIANKEEN